MKLNLKAFFFLKLQYTEKKVTKFLLSFVLLFLQESTEFGLETVFTFI